MHEDNKVAFERMRKKFDKSTKRNINYKTKVQNKQQRINRLNGKIYKYFE